jgi:hypothetical protein
MPGRTFRVHELAAGKKRQPARKKTAETPVKVTKVNPDALKLAHEMTKGTDTHIEIRSDGTIFIRNGKRKK